MNYFQNNCMDWATQTFGEKINTDLSERNQRFLEEALELVQSTGMTSKQSHAMVDYVFARPIGETHQEIGGVMVCLALLCSIQNFDMNELGSTEISRCWDNQAKIKAKQAQKPKFIS